MFKNYIKIGWRSIVRQGGFTIINIAGLATGLTCCICIGLYIYDEYSVDRFHSRGNHIYRVIEDQNIGDDHYRLAVTPGPLGPALKNDFEEIQDVCRIGKVRQVSVFTTGESTIEPEHVLKVDNSFFSLFDFRLLLGNTTKVLLGPDEAVVSVSAADKLFGSGWTNDDLLGKHIVLNNRRVLTLVGIAEDAPPNSHIQFDVLLSLIDDEMNASNNFNWNSNNYHTYLSIDARANVPATAAMIKDYLAQHSDDNTTTLALQPLFDIYLHPGFDFHTEWNKTGSSVYIRVFIAVGAIVLLIALFNYINLSTARSMSRAKEVGVRKMTGAVRWQLMLRFLTETFLTTVLAIVMALVLVELALPILNAFSGKSLDIPFGKPVFAAGLILFVVLVSITAGLYPAVYLSEFHPIKALKGFFALRSSQIFRKSLVVSQFTLSVVLITGTIVIYTQLDYISKKHLGFDKAQLMFVQMKADLQQKAALMKRDLLTETSISQVSVSSGNLDDVNASTGAVWWEGKQEADRMLTSLMNVDPDFISATAMTLAAGRNFDPAIRTDTSMAFIINETAARTIGWANDQAVGKKISLWGKEGYVIGVVKDFHFMPMTNAIQPLLLRHWPQERMQGLFVRFQPDRAGDAIGAIRRTYKRYSPHTILSYQFVDEALDKHYRTQQQTAQIILCFSAIAIGVSCLGLFGLAVYSAERRTKEVGIRKVLGASVSSIVNLLAIDFIRLVLIAIMMAYPIAWWAMSEWLDGFAYRITLEWWMFAMAGAVAVSIAALTVLGQSIKAGSANPVKNLRME
jgi:putative ABC transport system permease protein